MSTIDPKWIQYDDNVLTIIDDNGTNELSIRTDAVLTGVSAEKVNGTRITVSDTEPTTTAPDDVWIETP